VVISELSPPPLRVTNVIIDGGSTESHAHIIIYRDGVGGDALPWIVQKGGKAFPNAVETYILRTIAIFLEISQYATSYRSMTCFDKYVLCAMPSVCQRNFASSLKIIESNPCIILDKEALVIIFKIVFRTRLGLLKLDGVALYLFLPFYVRGAFITFLNFFCAGHILLFQHNCCNTFWKPLFAVWFLFVVLIELCCVCIS
jgi:hypothetical protein